MKTTTARRTQLPVLPAQRVTDDAVASTDVLPADAPRIGLVTLGCDKNTVDSERLLARLARAGAHVSTGPADADVIVINTCGFIDIAKEESVDAILDAVRLKAEGRVRAVVAMGCMVQRYREDLQREISEVDLFLGLTEAERLVPELRARGLLRAGAIANMEQPLRLLSTSTLHSSYLKISEGCDHTCAFCAIPMMRGRHRSTPIDALAREARELAERGVVELNLISQDTTWYGRDIARGVVDTSDTWFIGRTYDGMRGIVDEKGDSATAGKVSTQRAPLGPRHGLLTHLLNELLRETDIPWLRLFYMYPSGIHSELVELIAREPRIVPYLDMPIQHGADTVLKRMRRPERQATIRERVRWLRDAVPDVALRTTCIVGFPGETEEEFEAMLDLLEEIRFDHLGAFMYSVEEDTPAASMPDQVPDAVKRERLERLLDVQRGIAQDRNEAWLGREATVLVDAVTGRGMSDLTEDDVERGAVGRIAQQAPEIDGAVHMKRAPGVRPGRFVRVRLVNVIENDFEAELLDDTDG